MSEPCWLGVDVGTSACKVVAVDADLRVLTTASASYPLHHPRPAWVEQDPHDWWEGVVTATREVVAALGGGESVQGLGLCGQMHGLVALDAHDEVVRPALLWNDQRNGAECTWLVDQVGGAEALRALTENAMLPCFTAGKLVWLRHHEPESFARMRSWLNPKDFIRLRMTGEHVTDVSDASGTGMLDVRRRRWSEEVVAAAGLEPTGLPTVVESDAPAGVLHAEAARTLGLPVGLPVVGGGGDSVLQTTSQGVIDPGPLGVTLGTAGIVGAASAHCPENPGGRLQVSCGNAPDRWHVMGVALNAGGAWEWWRAALAPLLGGRRPDHDVLRGLLDRSEPGARGVHFLPYLSGERSPHLDPEARGGWLGLGMGHDVADMTRAVLEGALFTMQQIRELFAEAGLATDDVRVSGGASVHPVWLTTLAGVFDSPVRVVEGSEHGGAMGAALLAGIGGGAWEGLAAVLPQLRTTATWEPDPATRVAYRRAYDLHRALYPAAREWFAEAAAAEQP